MFHFFFLLFERSVCRGKSLDSRHNLLDCLITSYKRTKSHTRPHTAHPLAHAHLASVSLFFRFLLFLFTHNSETPKYIHIFVDVGQDSVKLLIHRQPGLTT